MKFTPLAITLLAALGAQAQEANVTEYANGLIAALNQNNLSSLASAIQRISGSVVPLLGAAVNARQNLTVLAPTNAAFAQLGNNIGNEVLTETILYHVLNGTWRRDQDDDIVVAPTLLNNQNVVYLPNNRSQVVLLNKQGDNDNETTIIKQPRNNVTFVAGDGVQYQNVLVRPINTVLTVPGNLSSLAAAVGVSSLAALLTQAELLQPLEATRSGLTIFAPINAAISSIQGQVAQLTPEQRKTVLLQHVLNSTVVYSPDLPDSAVNAAGQTLRFDTGDDDQAPTVTLGNITARITRTDLLFRGGVVHAIDRVLVSTEENADAAASAFDSNTSAAATNAPAPTNTGNGNGGGNGNAAGVRAPLGLGALALAFAGSAAWLLL